MTTAANRLTKEGGRFAVVAACAAGGQVRGTDVRSMCELAASSIPRVTPCWLNTTHLSRPKLYNRTIIFHLFSYFVYVWLVWALGKQLLMMI